MSGSAFNLGEKPYTAEYKKVKHTIKERNKKTTSIAVFNSKLSNIFQF